jgi:hypothetical protein
MVAEHARPVHNECSGAPGCLPGLPRLSLGGKLAWKVQHRRSGRGGQPCSLVFDQLRPSPRYCPGGPSPPDPHDRGWSWWFRGWWFRSRPEEANELRTLDLRAMCRTGRGRTLPGLPSGEGTCAPLPAASWPSPGTYSPGSRPAPGAGFPPALERKAYVHHSLPDPPAP